VTNVGSASLFLFTFNLHDKFTFKLPGYINSLLGYHDIHNVVSFSYNFILLRSIFCGDSLAT